MRQTYTASVDVEGGKTIQAECDRFGDAMAEVTAMMRGAFERLCASRDWNVLWDTFKVEVDELRVRA